MFAQLAGIYLNFGVQAREPPCALASDRRPDQGPGNPAVAGAEAGLSERECWGGMVTVKTDEALSLHPTVEILRFDRLVDNGAKARLDLAGRLLQHAEATRVEKPISQRRREGQI